MEGSTRRERAAAATASEVKEPREGHKFLEPARHFAFRQALVNTR